MPFERDLYITMLANYIKEQEEKIRSRQQR